MGIIQQPMSRVRPGWFCIVMQNNFSIELTITNCAFNHKRSKCMNARVSKPILSHINVRSQCHKIALMNDYSSRIIQEQGNVINVLLWATWRH
jgi:hypothetical protein